jgi:hypothetical protein
MSCETGGDGLENSGGLGMWHWSCRAGLPQRQRFRNEPDICWRHEPGHSTGIGKHAARER